MKRIESVCRFLLPAWVWMGLCLQAAGLDVVTLKSGAVLKGAVIERTASEVAIKVIVGERELIRKYPMDRVESIKLGSSAANPSDNSAVGPNTGAGDSQWNTRSREAVLEKIETEGRTPPPWFDSASLDYPPTLDLTWKEASPAIWNYKRHVPHFIWDYINTNPARYRDGVRLMHHLLSVNEKRPESRARVMNELGRMYYEFFNDFARAAFWWRAAGVAGHAPFRETPAPAQLAECYWRLGNREMAVELLNRIPLTPAVIKLWADLKETEKALTLVDTAVEQGMEPGGLYLLAGDACRGAGDFDRALEFYRKAIAAPAEGRQKEAVERNRKRAVETIELIRLFDQLNVADLQPGTYEDKSYGYSGNVYVEAKVNAGELTSLRVTSLSDRQYYHAVESTIQRILKKQSVQGIDAVSGATITSEAVVRATAKALSQGSEGK